MKDYSAYLVLTEDSPKIREVLKSVISQTFSNFDLYIVDIRQSNEISIDDYLEDLRVRLIKPTEEELQTKSMFEICSSKYIFVLDENDINLHDRFLIQSEELEHHPSCSMIVGGVLNPNSDTEIKCINQYGELDKYLSHLVFKNQILPSSVLINVGKINSLKLTLKSHPSDIDYYEFWVNLAKLRAPIFRSPRSVVRYQSRSKKPSMDILNKYNEIRTNLQKDHEENYIYSGKSNLDKLL